MEKILNQPFKQQQEELLSTQISKTLTKCELKVLLMISKGYTTPIIANKQSRSVHTIKAHRKHIRNKLALKYSKRLGVYAGKKAEALKTLFLLEAKNLKSL